MKKKVIAVMLATVLCFSTSLTAFATSTSQVGTVTVTGGGDSSSVTSSDEGSGDSTPTVEETAPSSTLSGAITDENSTKESLNTPEAAKNYKNAEAAEVKVVVVGTGQVYTLNDVISETFAEILSASSATSNEAGTPNEAGTSNEASGKTYGERLSDLMEYPLSQDAIDVLDNIDKDPTKKSRINPLHTYNVTDSDKAKDNGVDYGTVTIKGEEVRSIKFKAYDIPDDTQFNNVKEAIFLVTFMSKDGKSSITVPATLLKNELTGDYYYEAPIGDFVPYGFHLYSMLYDPVQGQGTVDGNVNQGQGTVDGNVTAPLAAQPEIDLTKLDQAGTPLHNV
jgi:hypothetical protein